jgi:hypothetical protein
MERQEITLFDVTRNEWMSLRNAFKEFDVESGEETEADNCWDARLRTDWKEDEVMYWSRSSWREGFWHAKMVLIPATEDTCTIVLVRGDDPKAMLLTRTLEYIEPFLRKHKGAT